MPDKLIHLDQQLFELINQSGNAFWDPIMLALSSKWIWIPVFLLIIWLTAKNNKKKGLYTFLVLLLTITLTDQLSAQLIKEVVQRLRPCHDPDMIQSVRLVADHCGGQFGFVSSHASNAFGIAIFSILTIRKIGYSMFILSWALLVSYSRIYLGVHYPGDILGGILLGLIIGFLTFVLLSEILKRVTTNGNKD
jgi:undecaprenyl-diphosphatase